MHRVLVSLVAVVSIALALPARADPAQNGAKAPKVHDRADELFDLGAAAYHEGRYTEAEKHLGAAWSLKRTHDIAGNLGVVENRLGKYAEAAEHLTWALVHFPPTESPRARRGYEQELAKARAEVGVLRIRVSVEGAELTMNGRAIGRSPLAEEVFVAPGAVSASASREGYVTARQSITIGKGEAREVSLALVPVTASRPSLVPGVVLASVAGAALATGIGLFAASRGKYADAKGVHDAIERDHGTCVAGGAHHDARCDALHDAAATSDRLHDASIGLFVGAGAAALGAGAYFLWARLPASTAKQAAALRIVPGASPSSAGVVISGAF